MSDSTLSNTRTPDGWSNAVVEPLRSDQVQRPYLDADFDDSTDTLGSNNQQLPEPVINAQPQRASLGADSNASVKAIFGPNSLSEAPSNNFNMYKTEERMPHRLRGREEIEQSRNIEIFKVHSVHFELAEGDTLVFIDYTDSKRQGKLADCNGIAYHSVEFRVHSERLRATGSAKFAEMLAPTYQFRVQRRRKLVNKLPDGVKFVLDLSPPSEGDELVFQMTELSLTPGIIKWWDSENFHGVDRHLVCGHDDVCHCMRETEPDDSSGEEPVPPGMEGVEVVIENQKPFRNKKGGLGFVLKPEEVLQMKARGENEHFKTPNYLKIPDYCPIRHRNAIIRLFLFIEGHGLVLDSANRVWTMVKVSKILDCASVLQNIVLQWIMHGRNTRFIEVLPEEALQIGFDLELPDVTQCAFRILVNELALREAADPEKQKKLDRNTIFGRKVGDLPDELNNLVQHAARAFLERISQLRAMMANPDLLDFWNVGEWSKLCQIENLASQGSSPAHQNALHLIRVLKGYLSTQLKETLDFESIPAVDTSNRNGMVFFSMDLDRTLCVEPKNFETTEFIMKDMNIMQKMLCPLIYNDLGNRCECDFFVGRDERFPEIAGNDPYQAVLGPVTQAIQRIIDENPRLAFVDDWSACFDQERSTFDSRVIRQVRKPVISLDRLEDQIKEQKLRLLTLSWSRHDIVPSLNITRHMLLTLNNDELKYLPLWAGGCDDGTGGVFETFVPPTDMGPTGPGPSYHTGLTMPSAPASISSSMMEEMAAMKVMGSTTAESVDVHDSISTVYRRDRVVPDDVSMASDSFTSGGTEYQAARYEVPAGHQDMGQAMEAVVTATDDDDTDTGLSTLNGGESEVPWQDDSDSDDSFTTV